MTPSEIHKENVRFPNLYSSLIRILQVELMPWHFYDIGVMALIGMAFFISVMNMGGLSQQDSVLSVRFIAAAAGMHVFGNLVRSKKGFRIRWGAALFVPAAIWMCADLYLRGDSWRGGEQMAVALASVTAMWVVAHHQGHASIKWFLFGGMGAVAALFGIMVVNADQNILPRLAKRTVSIMYEGQATGPFGTPGEFGAFLLLAAFPSAAVLVSPSLRYRRRIAALCVTALTLIGLYSAHHAPSWYGALAGAAVLALLLIPSRRTICFALTAIIGVAFFVPKIAHMNTGVFRKDVGVAPMLDSSMQIFAGNPIFGVGPGNFPGAFETVRPAAFNHDPLTAGGFFTNLLAEGGLVGFILLVIPGVLLWISYFLVTSRDDVRLLRRDRQFDSKKSYVPEGRLSGAAILAATLGAGISLGLDYSRPSLTLALAFAIYAGIAIRVVFGKSLSSVAYGVDKPRYAVRALIGFLPICAIFFYVFPVFVSSQKARYAEDIVLRLEKAGKPTTISPIPIQRRNLWIDIGLKSVEGALKINPNNVRASSAMAELLMARYRLVGDKAGLDLAYEYAKHTARLAPLEPVFQLPLLTATGMKGDFDAYDRMLGELRKKAPNSGPLALEEARRHLTANRIAEARAIIEPMLALEPWSAEARRLNRLMVITEAPSAQ